MSWAADGQDLNELQHGKLTPICFKFIASWKKKQEPKTKQKKKNKKNKTKNKAKKSKTKTTKTQIMVDFYFDNSLDIFLLGI